MGKVSMGLSFIKSYFGRGTKIATAETAQAAAGFQPVTRTLTNPVTGAVEGLEREFMRDGERCLVRSEYLGNGERKMTVYNKDGQPIIWDVKKTTREEGNVFGGDRVIVDRKRTVQWSHSDHAILTKDYNKAGSLEHKELNFVHDSGNGLNDYSHVATQDRVYAEHPLTEGYKDMLTIKPCETKGIKHSLDSENNYYQFTQKGTNYERAVEAQRAAEQAKIAEAEAAKAAAVKAEQEAAEKLAASRPRVNTGKVFNRNIEEFKCVEETRPDGSIVRRYYDPMHSANGKSNPMITTIDKGSYHEELIYDPIKGIKLSYKQSGKGEPKIEMTRGLQYRYTSKMVPDDYNQLVRRNEQIYNDGASYVEFYGKSPNRFDVNFKNRNPREYIEENPETWGGEYINQSGYGHVEPYSLYAGPTKNEVAAQRRLDEITQEANTRRINLMDLFRPYQP